MKYIIVCFLAITFVFSSCSSDDTEDFLTVDFESPTFLIGKWKMTGSYTSPGSGQFYSDILDGEELLFGTDGSFTTSSYPSCNTATYTVSGDDLSITYDCDAFKEQFPELDGRFIYSMSNKDDFLILIPKSRLCIEGCSYYYQKIAD
ncbi:MAG: lipocalin family protein [Leeuwenhoekiella sp.]